MRDWRNLEYTMDWLMRAFREQHAAYDPTNMTDEEVLAVLRSEEPISDGDSETVVFIKKYRDLHFQWIVNYDKIRQLSVDSLYDINSILLNGKYAEGDYDIRREVHFFGHENELEAMEPDKILRQLRVLMYHLYHWIDEADNERELLSAILRFVAGIAYIRPFAQRNYHTLITALNILLLKHDLPPIVIKEKDRAANNIHMLYAMMEFKDIWAEEEHFNQMVNVFEDYIDTERIRYDEVVLKK